MGIPSGVWRNPSRKSPAPHVCAAAALMMLQGIMLPASAPAEVALRPYPQATPQEGIGPRRERVNGGSSLSQSEMNAAVVRYYNHWKSKYLKPSVKVAGDYKVAFEPSGTTVSEAMGYGMLITVMMAGADPGAKSYFDGLNRFRKRYPSAINPEFMCWKVPASEKHVKNDSATDGDLDVALALLMAHRQWGDPGYLAEARTLISALSSSLVRPDFSLRLGDWDTGSPGAMLTRMSDFMPTHFRVFGTVSGDELWAKVENRCYEILGELQENNAPLTGLVPDFAEAKGRKWQPAGPKALEGPHDGEYSYNACRVPWRIGWSAIVLNDSRARHFLKPFMAWAATHVGKPENFKSGYHLDGRSIKGADYDSACFIMPAGVAAMSEGTQDWYDAAFAYGKVKKEGYYEDSVNLLCLLAMSGNAWLPTGR